MNFMLAVVMTLSLALNAIATRAVQGTWLAPASVNAVLWLLVAAVPLALLPDAPVGLAAVLFLITFVSLFTCGSLITYGYSQARAQSSRAGRQPRLPSVVVSARVRWLWWAFVVSLLLGYSAPVLTFFSAREVLQFDMTLFNVSSEITRARYTGGFHLPGMVIFGLLAAYIASGIAGVLVAARRLPMRVALLPLGALLLQLLLATTRLPLIIGIALFASGWVLTAPVARQRKLLPLYKLLLSGIAAIVLAGSVIFATQLLRNARVSPETVERAANSVVVYLAGNFMPFSQWFPGDGVQHRSLGSATFAAAAETLGLDQRIQGKYQEHRTVNADATSNIYSALRPLIEDFGVGGALIIAIALGGLSGFAWSGLRSGHRASFVVAALIYPYILLAPLTTVFHYSSSALAVVALAAIGAFMPGAWTADIASPDSPLRRRRR